MERKTRIATYCGVAVMWFVGGAIYPFLSKATETVPPGNIIVIRSIGAALILLCAVLIMAPKSFGQIRFNRSMIFIVLASLLFSPACSFSLAWASERVPGAITSLMYATLPAMSTIYVALRGHPISRNALRGVVISSCAVIFLIGVPQGGITPSGVIAALISVLAWFVATEVWIAHETGYPLILAIFLQVFVGAIGTTTLHFLIGAPEITSKQIFNPTMIFLIAALASQYWAYLGISRRVSPALLTSFGFVNPLVAAAIGFIAFGQKVTVVQSLAGICVLAGIYLVVRDKAAVTD